jgi:hypothetical protein
MNLPMDHHRAFRIVTGVLEEALRSSGGTAFVVSGGGPEEGLLAQWLDGANLPWQAPSPRSLEAAKGLLAGGEPGGQPPPGPGHHAPSPWDPGPEASALAGAALARARGLLHLGTANKTCLLLSSRAPLQPVLPLGDLYASQIRSMVGSCTVPAPFRGAATHVVEGVDRALKAYLEDGHHRHDALSGLPEAVRREVLSGLAAARRAWHPIPLIPKLSGATLGLDLDL